MRKFSYWVSEAGGVPVVHNIRRGTRKEVLQHLKALGYEPVRDTSKRSGVYYTKGVPGPEVPRVYGSPRKITVSYLDPLNLLCQCLGQGGREGNIDERA